MALMHMLLAYMHFLDPQQVNPDSMERLLIPICNDEWCTQEERQDNECS